MTDQNIGMNDDDNDLVSTEKKKKNDQHINSKADVMITN